MLFDRNVVQILEQFSPAPLESLVFRHMFAKFPPERENVRGARWNPPQIPAIYTSLTREAAISEADYYINLQPIRPSAKRIVYQIKVVLDSVLDISNSAKFSKLGLNYAELASVDHDKCWQIGGAVEWLGHDGLLVPSARSEGINLVIFPNRKTPNYRFDVLQSEEVTTD